MFDDCFVIHDQRGWIFNFSRTDGYFWQYGLVEGTIDRSDKSIIEIMRENDDGCKLVATFINSDVFNSWPEFYPAPHKHIIHQCRQCGLGVHAQKTLEPSNNTMTYDLTDSDRLDFLSQTKGGVYINPIAMKGEYFAVELHLRDGMGGRNIRATNLREAIDEAMEGKK